MQENHLAHLCPTRYTNLASSFACGSMPSNLLDEKYHSRNPADNFQLLPLLFLPHKSAQDEVTFHITATNLRNNIITLTFHPCQPPIPWLMEPPDWFLWKVESPKKFQRCTPKTYRPTAHTQPSRPRIFRSSTRECICLRLQVSGNAEFLNMYFRLINTQHSEVLYSKWWS